MALADGVVVVGVGECQRLLICAAELGPRLGRRPPVARELERVRLGRCQPERPLRSPPAGASRPARRRTTETSARKPARVHHPSPRGPPPYGPRARRPRRSQSRPARAAPSRPWGRRAGAHARVAPTRPGLRGARATARARQARRRSPSPGRRARATPRRGVGGIVPPAPVELQLAAHRDQIRPPAVEVVLLAVVDPRLDRGLARAHVSVPDGAVGEIAASVGDLGPQPASWATRRLRSSLSRPAG